MTFAQVTWVSDMQFVGMADSGHAVALDAKKEGGGYGSGSSPMELLLMGVAGCTAMDVISILKKKRQPVEGLKVLATGERNAEHPTYYTAIHIEFVATGAVEEAALARAIELSQEKYCGAAATVRGVAKLTTSYRIEPGPAR
jgi:putative redox protein